MKKLIIIPLLIFALNLNTGANPGAAIAMFFFSGTWVPVVNHFVNFNPHGVTGRLDRNGAMLSVSMDPVVRISQKAVDLKMSGGFKIGKWNPYVCYEEAFAPINLKEYSAGVRYKFAHWDGNVKIKKTKFKIPGHFLFLTGVEIGRRENEGQKVWFEGVDFQIEWFPHNIDGGLFINFGIDTRRELSNPAIFIRDYQWLNSTPNFMVGAFLFITN